MSAEGTNQMGNNWVRHSSPNVEYEYFNANGSHYTRFIDGSAMLEGDFPTVHYPAPQPELPAEEALNAEGQDHTPAHD